MLDFSVLANILKKEKKICYTLLDLSVSSLRRGHANLLCIVPILTGDLIEVNNYFFKPL